MPETCKYCGLDTGRTLGSYLGKKPKGKRIAIVGGEPNADDIIFGKPFSGQSGEFLTQVLSENGVDIEECFLVNVMCCQSKEGQSLSLENHIDVARPNLFNDLEQFNPDVIIALGSTALQGVLGEPGKDYGKIANFRGIWHDIQLGSKKVPVMPTFHPGFVMMVANKFQDFTRDMQRAFLPRLLFPEPTLTLVEDMKLAKELFVGAIMRQTNDAGIRAWDIETDGLKVESDILCIGVTTNPEMHIVFSEEFMHSEGANEYFCQVNMQKNLTHSGHNFIAFDQPVIEHFIGGKFPCDLDTMLSHWVVDERYRTHGLKDIARNYYGIPNYEEEAKKYLDSEWGYKFAPRDILYKYLTWDTALGYQVVLDTIPKMQEGKLQKFYDNILVPAAKTFRDVKKVGVKIDRPYFEDLGNKWSTETEKLQLDLQLKAQEFGFEGRVKGIKNPIQELLNPNSTQQLREVLYEVLELPKLRKLYLNELPIDTPLDETTTDKSVLNELKLICENTEGKENEVEFLDKLITFRRLGKLNSTFVKGWLERLDDRDMLYPEYSVIGTVTGRLACFNPNLTNVPKRDVEGREAQGLIPYGMMIRGGICPHEGCVLFSGDYSQLELRLIAWFSQDARLLEIFSTGIDPHTAAAAEIFGIPYEEASKKQYRDKGKTFNFAVAYGQGLDRMAQTLHATVEETKRWKEQYDKTFAGMTKFKKETEEFILEEGYSETAYGNRRRFPFIPNYKVRGQAMREGFNAPIQGTGGIVCTMAAVRVHNELPRDKVKVVGTVHDELIVQINKGYEDEFGPQIAEIMQHPDLEYRGVNWEVDWKIKSRWAEV